VKPRLSFANVTSVLALFIALGGTSYAAVNLSSNSVNKAHLRTNSVGKSEIRTKAVGRSEIGTSGVSSSEIRNSGVGTADVRDTSLEIADLSPAARTALADLNGVTFRASATAAGALTAGNARSLAHTANSGVYTIELGRDVSACQYSADVTGVKTGTTIEEPTDPISAVAVASPSATNTQVIVRTYNAAGATPAAADRPFSLFVAC
jgi:hypothetical protein